MTFKPPAPAYRPKEGRRPDLDLTQRLQRKLAEYNASQNILKRWLFEIVSVATSALCMGAIIAILVVLQNEPLQKWPFGLTVVTFLSKIASAALIIPISEAIGQLKWAWFHGKQSKDIFDFEIFDKASRGAWGSFLLLVRTKGRSLAALGATLTVLLLAIDSFFQQVTDLPERWTLHGTSFIARSVRYEPDVVYAWESDKGDIPIAQSNHDLKRALSPYFYDQNGTQRSTFRNGSDDSFPSECSTSKCEWSPYQTLGVCSACADISKLLTYACLPMALDWLRSSTGPSTESTWPNGTACGYFLNATSASPVLMSGYRTDNVDNSTYGETLLMRSLPFVTNNQRKQLNGGSINFKHINTPIINALIVSSADGTASSVYRKEMPIAQECMLAWCVKTLHSSYSWGLYQEEVLNEFFNTSEAPYPWATKRNAETDITATDFTGNYSMFPPGMSRKGLGFGVSNDTFMDTVFVLDEIFPALITVQTPTAQPFLKVRTSFTNKVFYRAFRFSPWLAPNNVTNHMARLATAMTNVFRADIQSNELVSGDAFAPETYVAVHWGWLTFPLAMLVFSIIFLAATIRKTSQGNNESLTTWKTSAMPTLIYSLPEDMRRDLTTSAASGRVADRNGEKVKIRLMPNQGWRVSRPTGSSPTLLSRSYRSAPPGWI